MQLCELSIVWDRVDYQVPGFFEYVQTAQATFGEARIRLASSDKRARASLAHWHEEAHSCRDLGSEPCSGQIGLLVLHLECLAAPDKCPAMLEAPSYACPTHCDR